MGEAQGTGERVMIIHHLPQPAQEAERTLALTEVSWSFAIDFSRAKALPHLTLGFSPWASFSVTPNCINAPLAALRVAVTAAAGMWGRFLLYLRATGEHSCDSQRSCLQT